MLRELRPVSYQFINGSESKYTRFGFVADELKEILPDVVREDVSRDASTGAQYQGVIYQDLIAVRILALLLIIHPFQIIFSISTHTNVSMLFF